MGHTRHTKPIDHLTAYTPLNRVLPGHAAGANSWQRSKLVNWRTWLNGLARLHRRLDNNSTDAAIHIESIGVDFDWWLLLDIRDPGMSLCGPAEKGKACGDSSNH